MGTRRGTALVFAVLALAAGWAEAQDFGRMVYLEGGVTFFAQGEEAYADIGTAVAPGDLIRTAADGYVELEIRTGPTTVVVAEDTVLYVEEDTARGRTETGFQLLRGNVDFVVDRLVGGNSVSVRTQTVALGVRGTEFKVRQSPDDSLVVGVTEGQVSVERERERVIAGAGTAVESVNRGSLQKRRVPEGEMDNFLAQWEQTRMQAFRSGAETFIVAYAERYEDQYPRFLDAYRNLSPYADELREAAGQSGIRGRGQRFRLRAEVSGPAVEMRSILPIFENTFYRLDELAAYHAEGLGRTPIHSDLTSEEFFRTFASRRDRTEARMAHIRYLLRLYKRLEEGTMGGLPSGESPFESDEIMPDF
jgi:hypothetical protein